MPQSVTIDLPLVIIPHGGLSLVRPIGFTEFALASGSDERAVRAVRRRVIRSCKRRVGSELVYSVVRGDPELQMVMVEIAPQQKSPEWREPIEVRLDTVSWNQDGSLVISYVPMLDLTVVATPQADLQTLVQEQIRSAIRRRGAWSLMGLARWNQSAPVKLRNERLTVPVATPAERAREDEDKPRSKTPTLSAVATRLNPRSFPMTFHREGEVAQLGQLLSATNPRSVLLVGPSGVGKTAIFQQWVRLRGQPGIGGEHGMSNVQCWATDGSRLISGQSGFGMWQRQCLAMADEARRYPTVIHLGNLVELSESGRLRGSGGCGSLLAPRLADGSLRCVIECTSEQLTRIQRTEPKLIASLTIMRVEEPSPAQTRSILLEAAASWRPINITARLKKKKRGKRRRQKGRESRRQISAVEPMAAVEPTPAVEPEALQVLDRLHRRFRTDAASPGRPLAFFHAVMSELGRDQTLDVSEVIAAFGRQTGLPSFLIDESVRPDLASIEEQLRSQVIGQDVVIETLVDMIATLAADLARGDRPLASLMLIGPTGVGKTETAKALARLIYSDVGRLVRIDMSELSTPSAVGRLIGDAMHPEGVLTSAVRAQPFSLVLLDEFEKAHPSVFDLLLQVLGEGRLTDGRGRLADFRNSIVLMTSNLGVESFRAVPLGLADTQRQLRYRNHFERHVREFLRPEMFNRIDRILTYDPLDQGTVEQIARLRIGELRHRDGWKGSGDELEVDEEALRLLARGGYQAQYGARPLARELERRVATPLAEAICDSGRLSRLKAAVSVKRTGDDGADERVSVRVQTVPPTAKRSDESTESLIEQLTLLRRRGQALARCDAVRRLRNQYTMVSRKIKTLLRATKNQDHRSKIRYGPLGADRIRQRERLQQIRALCREIDEAESDVLLRYYQEHAIDMSATSGTLERLRDRLWNTLCELHSDSSMDNQRLTLVVTGPNLHVADRLLSGYRYVARSRDWNLQVHALLGRDIDADEDRSLDAEGWGEKPAFRIMARSSDVPILSGESTPDAPRLAAYRLIRSAALTTIPDGTLGLMMTFRGKAAGLAVATEVGVHSFSSLRRPRSSGHSLLITKHAGMPIDYVAPNWLVKRDFQLDGHPRRWYDSDSDVVQEMGTDYVRRIQMDREGRWLDLLIEQEMERRIWSALDEDGSDPLSDDDASASF